MKKMFNTPFIAQKNKHIFFISSPIVELVVASYIEEFEISYNDIILIPLRKYTPNLINAKVLNIYFPLIEKIFYRLFLISFEGLLIRLIIGLKKVSFYLYTPWDVPQYYSLRKLKNCLGQVYVEEGQMSHNKIYPYKMSKNYNQERRRLHTWRKSHVTQIKKDKTSFRGFFNRSAMGYLALTRGSFPEVDRNKKLFLKIPQDLISNYVEKTSAAKNIGIMPAPRRLVDIGWESVIDKFIEILPEGSMIKLHPGFEVNKQVYLKLERYLLVKSRGTITLCPKGTVIEMEMAKNKKVLYGPLTSLKRYANFLGSRFIDLKVY